MSERNPDSGRVCDKDCEARDHVTTAEGVCPLVKAALRIERAYYDQGNQLDEGQQAEWERLDADELLARFYDNLYARR